MKKLAAFALSLMLCLPLIGCTAKTITFDIGRASRIELTSGSTGDTVEIADEAAVRHITDNINALTFTDEGKCDFDGWSYSVRWMDAHGNAMISITLLGSGRAVIGDHCYSVSGGSVDLEFIRKQFG